MRRPDDYMADLPRVAQQLVDQLALEWRTVLRNQRRSVLLNLIGSCLLRSREGLSSASF